MGRFRLTSQFTSLFARRTTQSLFPANTTSTAFLPISLHRSGSILIEQRPRRSSVGAQHAAPHVRTPAAQPLLAVHGLIRAASFNGSQTSVTLRYTPVS